MLKATVDHNTWLVQQHHHAQVSGFLAAHWGDANGFASPGHEPGATHPDRWRDQVVLAIAEHDNGWWETEAMPRISARDGLPVGVGEAAPPTDENEFTPWISGGFDRWRRGIDRIASAHPYAALLISMHAYWLYAVAYDDLLDDEPRRHFVFGAPDVAAGLIGDRTATRDYLDDLRIRQSLLESRIADDPTLARALEPEHRNVHFRLLQLFDSMSLYLALNDRDDHELPDIPRAGWRDRVTITWRRAGARTIELDPYPFRIDGLQVPMPMRIVERDDGAGDSPLARLHAAPMQTVEFIFRSRG
ncbi:MAG: DUF3891 family protein [Phycisphaerales bacterium]